MDETASAIKWARCLEIIKCNVTEQDFRTWFQPIDFVTYDQERKELLLRVPSEFFFEMLDGQFKKLMHNVMWRVYSKDTFITYRIQKTDDTTIDRETTPTNAKLRKGKDDKLQAPRKPSTDDLDPQLNQEYRFENFIEGESNKFAYSVGKAIADNPKQTTFNPFFIHGSSGVGKTHLVNAIGMRIKELHPKHRVLYVAAHQFMVQFTESRRTNTFNNFIAFYQTIDTLIIDDIQELASSTMTATQDAFFHVFNHLKMNGKQIIMTCDRPPSTLKGMEERLLTRFKWGVTAELEKPTQELCRRILLSKIRRDGLTIPDDVVNYLAGHSYESVRDLEGIVNSLLAYSVVYNHEIDLDMAEQIVRRTVKRQSKQVSLEQIVNVCCEYWKVSQDDVFSKSRKANIVIVRQVAMFLTQKHTKLSTSKIGLHIGGRNHATVLHSISQVKDRIAVDKAFAQQVSEVEGKIRG